MNWNLITQEELNSILEQPPFGEDSITISDKFFDGKIVFPSELKKITFRNCKFLMIDFEHTAFRDIVFTGCVFQTVKFEKNNMEYVEFICCDIYNGYFKNSALNGISFKYCKVPYCSFIGVSARRFMGYCTSFSSSVFQHCKFHDYCFDSCDMVDTEVSDSTLHLPQFIPSSGSFIGWKKALAKDSSGHEHQIIIKLRIPEDAERMCASHKCRASKVEVLGFETLDGEKLPDDTEVFSWWNSSYHYKIGMAKPMYEIEPNPQVECASGIHFFLDREAAVNYQF